MADRRSTPWRSRKLSEPGKRFDPTKRSDSSERSGPGEPTGPGKRRRSGDGGRIRHTGTVLEVRDGTAAVRLDSGERCDGCPGCGIDEGVCTARVPDSVALEPGDGVVLGASTRAAGVGALLLFGLPLSGAVLGGVIGEALAAASVDAAVAGPAAVLPAASTTGTVFGILAGLILGTLPMLFRFLLRPSARESLRVVRVLSRERSL